MLILGDSGLKNELVCYFTLAAEMVRGDAREFVYDADGQAFPKKKLVELDVDRYQLVRVHDYTYRPVPSQVGVTPFAPV